MSDQAAPPVHETQGTDDVVCPYCGYVHQDSWEFESEEGTTECGRCEREFEYVREVEVSYSTYPKEEGESSE